MTKVYKIRYLYVKQNLRQAQIKMKSQQHGGQILRRVIAESGYKIKDVAKQAGMSRGGLYLQFKKEKINYKTLAQIGKVLKYDFNQLFSTA